MSPIAMPMEAPFLGPTLRLLPKTGSRRPRGEHLRLVARDTRTEGAGRATCSAAGARPVLLAGGDALQRAAVLHDLRQTMPEGTSFMQAGALWEMLAHAGESSMVVLSGELERVSTESLMQMLAHRNPKLPVVSVQPGL
jgi:hypothetical protein